MGELEKLYVYALTKSGFIWLPATPPGYLHSFDEFKQKMESDEELYNKLVEELTKTKMSKPEKTLELIREGYYNTDRLSNLIIKELVEVIELLDRKLKQNKDEEIN